MEEKQKKNNFSPRRKKEKDKDKDTFISEKDFQNKQAPKKQLCSLPENFYDSETIYKNKELNKFKDEILSYLRTRDYFYMEKINNLKTQSDKNDRNFESLNEYSLKNFNSMTLVQAEMQSKLEKLSTLDNFVNKANDKLLSHEIRINCLREDLSKNVQKYDKIYLDNLEVPGYIGRCSKYPNCKIFFTELIKEIDKLNTYREKNTLDLCTYKDRLENIIKTFQSLVENNNDSQIKYITKLNEKTNKDLLETLEENINNVRMDNSRFAKDLINKTSELNHLYEKMVTIKDYVTKEFGEKSEYFVNKINEINKDFDSYKIEYASIRKKFLELADFMKNGKFSKNFGGFYGKKEVNVMSKRLVKDNKETIEAKDVKLLTNEEMEKMDYKNDRVNTNKNNNNSNNNDNVKNNIIDRMSKSQNNFHINKNNKKKKTFGFMRDIEKNIMANPHRKNQNSIDASNNVKVHQGTVFYLGENKTKNIKKQNNTIVSVDRQTIIAKKKPIQNVERNNNEDLEDIHIEKLEKNDRKNNNFIDELSMSESCISNINNSINTFSTTNDKNNSMNSLINLNPNKNINKFIIEEDLKDNDKIIKELASELEQSTAKANKLASNKKEIEENFKNICNKIQPTNLKLDKLPLEQIPEQKNNTERDKEATKEIEKIEENINKNESININATVNVREIVNEKEKNRFSITNKSELNTTILSKNELNNNTINTTNNNNITNIEKNINKKSKDIRNSKSKIMLESKEKTDESNSINMNNTNNNLRNSINSTNKSNKSKILTKMVNPNQNPSNENTMLNETINLNIDKKMNIYDKKIGDLESFTREQIYEIMKQLSLIKKAYAFVTGIIKKDKFTNNMRLSGHNTSHNIMGQSGDHIFNNYINNENKNTMNITGNNFHRKSIKNENNNNSKYVNNGKIIQTMDDINLSDNLFYNGKYYFNIKDILDKNKNNINLNTENKKLLRKLDNKLQEDSFRNLNNSPKNTNTKNNNSLLADKWVDLKKLGKSNTKVKKPESGTVQSFNPEQK